jgi:hypothetical protein
VDAVALPPGGTDARLPGRQIGDVDEIVEHLLRRPGDLDRQFGSHGGTIGK